MIQGHRGPLPFKELARKQPHPQETSSQVSSARIKPHTRFYTKYAHGERNFLCGADSSRQSLRPRASLMRLHQPRAREGTTWPWVSHSLEKFLTINHMEERESFNRLIVISLSIKRQQILSNKAITHLSTLTKKMYTSHANRKLDLNWELNLSFLTGLCHQVTSVWSFWKKPAKLPSKHNLFRADS